MATNPRIVPPADRRGLSVNQTPRKPSPRLGLLSFAFFHIAVSFLVSPWLSGHLLLYL